MTVKEGKSILSQKIKVINVGLPLFAVYLKKQGVKAVHVDWKPPAEGDERMLEILERLLYS